MHFVTSASNALTLQNRAKYDVASTFASRIRDFRSGHRETLAENTDHRKFRVNEGLMDGLKAGAAITGAALAVEQLGHGVSSILERRINEGLQGQLLNSFSSLSSTNKDLVTSRVVSMGGSKEMLEKGLYTQLRGVIEKAGASTEKKVLEEINETIFGGIPKNAVDPKAYIRRNLNKTLKAITKKPTDFIWGEIIPNKNLPAFVKKGILAVPTYMGNRKLHLVAGALGGVGMMLGAKAAEADKHKATSALLKSDKQIKNLLRKGDLQRIDAHVGELSKSPIQDTLVKAKGLLGPSGPVMEYIRLGLGEIR